MGLIGCGAVLTNNIPAFFVFAIDIPIIIPYNYIAIITWNSWFPL